MQRILIGLLVVVVATALGLGLAWLADAGERQLLGWPLLPALAVIAFAIQWLAFIPAYIWQTEHYYDLTGSLTYLMLVTLAVLLSGGLDAAPRSLLLAVLVAAWALRLGTFLFRRVRRQGKDGRFDEIKTRWSRFLVTWTLQGLWVFVTLYAALIAITDPVAGGLGVWATVGGLVWLLGFGIEAVADAQKSRFAADATQKGRFIQSGLWAWSRHPNYFGEIVLWTGIALIALPTFAGWQWLGLISPLFVAALICGLSGVPLLEQRADERWGEDPEYQAYKARTPVLLPRPPKPEQCGRQS